MSSNDNPDTPGNQGTAPHGMPQPPQGQVSYVTAAPSAEPGTFKRGFGLGAGLGLGLLLTAVTVSVIAGIFSLLSIGALVSMVPSSVSTDTETIWGKDGATTTLRAFDISGAILTSAAEGGLFAEGTYGYEVADMLDELDGDDADGVVLLVNTPGGSITGSKAISDAIVRYQERTGNQVMVHVEGMSASGGVYSTAPADAIYADHGSIIGSVGVIFGPFSRFRDVVAISGNLLESGVTTTGGITEEYITQGTGKDFGNPFRDMTDGERQMIIDVIKPEYERFVAHLAEHRDMDPNQIVNVLGAGVFEPQRAEEVGFIDGTLGRDEFFREAATQVGGDPDDTRVEAVSAPGALESLFGIERVKGQAVPLSRSDAGSGMLSASLCSGQRPMVFSGDPAALCR